MHQCCFLCPYPLGTLILNFISPFLVLIRLVVYSVFLAAAFVPAAQYLKVFKISSESILDFQFYDAITVNLDHAHLRFIACSCLEHVSLPIMLPNCGMLVYSNPDVIKVSLSI